MQSSMRIGVLTLREISKCNSPAPATKCSPVPDTQVWTHGSDFDERLKPSTSFGRPSAFRTSTATCTLGDTQNFIAFMLYAVSDVVNVPPFSKNWSIPTRPTMLPAGQSSIGSTLLPIISPLDRLNEQVLLPSRVIMRSLNSDFGVC